LQKVAESNLEDLDLNSSAFFKVKNNKITSVIRSTSKGKKQIQLSTWQNGIIRSFNLPEDSKSRGGETTKSDISKRECTLTLESPVASLQVEKETRLYDTDGQNVRRISSGA
jgi:hypothetical protein